MLGQFINGKVNAIYDCKMVIRCFYFELEGKRSYLNGPEYSHYGY